MGNWKIYKSSKICLYKILYSDKGKKKFTEKIKKKKLKKKKKKKNQKKKKKRNNSINQSNQ